MSTVALIFDKESQDKLNKIKNSLSISNIRKNILNHISIADYDNVDIDKLNKLANNFFNDFKNLEIKIIGVNIFENKNTLYFEIELTDDLKRMQKEFIKYTNDLNKNIKKYYIKDWTPHITIGMNIDEYELNTSYKFLKDKIKFPIETKVDRLEILN